MCLRKSTAIAWRGVAARNRDYKERVTEISHFKAHQNLSEADQRLLRSFHGNGHADAHARLGALTRDLDMGAVADFGATYGRLRRLARHIAQVAARFPTYRELVRDASYSKPPSHASPAKARKKTRGHSMVWLGSRFRCVLCCKQSRSRLGPKIVCQGVSGILRAITATDWGHDLAYVSVSRLRTLYFCRRCGAYAEARSETKGAVDLTKPCGPPSRSSSRSLSLIMSGRHPTVSGPASMSRVYSLNPTPAARTSSFGGAVRRDAWVVVDERPGIRATPDIINEDSE